MRRQGARVETTRAADHDIATGVWPDMTEHGAASDAWPALYERVLAADTRARWAVGCQPWSKPARAASMARWKVG